MGYLFLQPWVFVRSGSKLLLAFPAKEQARFSIHFIHSVQKTPVIENLMVNDTSTGFQLISTKYQSFGVGLPFLASEGVFRQEGNYFILDRMDRKFGQLALRTGVDTQLTIFYQGVAYPVYQRLVDGSKIDLHIAPYYQRFIFIGTKP